MPDVNSPLLQLVIQAVGGNENTWGDVLNENILRIETAIAGSSSITITGNVTLSDDQARPGVILLTGAPSAPANVVYPSRPRVFTVFNACSGSQPVTVKTAAGTGIIVPRGRLITLFCDGSSIEFVQSASEVGIGGIVMNAGSATQGWDNYLPCLGQEVSRSTYAKLFNAIGTAWGAGDGSTTFTLPSSDNRYPRGGQANEVGAVLEDAVKEHSHTGTVTVSGTGTGTISGTAPYEDSVPSVSQAIVINNGVQISVPTVAGISSVISNKTATVSGSASVNISGSGTFTTGNTGESETRPKSFTVLYMIRFQ